MVRLVVLSWQVVVCAWRNLVLRSLDWVMIVLRAGLCFGGLE